LHLVIHGVQALRQVRESEEHRARMLQEPSLLQALVSLTALDADTDALEEAETVEWRSAELVRESELKAEVKKHAMLTILQLSTTSSHAQLFLQLLPAMPLVRLAGIGGAELQYACARLLFLLARPASGCARSTQLAEAAAQPLVKLCAVAHIKVQYAAAQAVERLAQHTEHGRHVLFDAGVLPPLVAMLGSIEGFTQQSAACAIRQLSMSSTRRYMLRGAGTVARHLEHVCERARAAAPRGNRCLTGR